MKLKKVSNKIEVTLDLDKASTSKTGNGISRRDFLRHSGILAGGTALHQA